MLMIQSTKKLAGWARREASTGWLPSPCGQRGKLTPRGERYNIKHPHLRGENQLAAGGDPEPILAITVRNQNLATPLKKRLTENLAGRVADAACGRWNCGIATRHC